MIRCEGEGMVREQTEIGWFWHARQQASWCSAPMLCVILALTIGVCGHSSLLGPSTQGQTGPRLPLGCSKPDKTPKRQVPLWSGLSGLWQGPWPVGMQTGTLGWLQNTPEAAPRLAHRANLNSSIENQLEINHGTLFLYTTIAARIFYQGVQQYLKKENG